MNKSPERIGVIYKSGQANALELSSAVIERFGLEQRSWTCPTSEVAPDLPEARDTDLIITFGGDGTIIQAARVSVPNGIPILGINMGRLGFMTELRADEVFDKMPRYLEGDGWIEERSMLHVNLLSGGKNGSADRSPEADEAGYHAINDAVVGRGATSRLIGIRAFVDGVELTEFRADAVMVATATGSTGYNLSAGGPILWPQAGEMILKAVAPHVGMAPALVLPGTSVVDLVVETDHQATLSVDGYVDVELQTGARVKVERSSSKAKFLRAEPPTHFYSTLTGRLGFGGGQSSTRAINY